MGTPELAPGWGSTSISRTTARRSPVSCDSPVAPRARPGSARRSTSRRSPTRRIGCTSNRRVRAGARDQPRVGASTIATTTATFAIHDATQLVVGIVAERPGDIIADLDLLPNANNLKPVTIAVDVTGLPKRVEAWGALDRLIWQDTDASRLESDQLAAMRGWIAGGGRLVIVGGTAGAASLVGVPRRDPAVPTDGHDRRRPGLAQRSARRTARGRHRASRPRRDPDRGSAAGECRRPGDRRGPGVWQRQRHDRRVRSDLVLAQGDERRRIAVAPGDPDTDVGWTSRR